MTAPDQHAASVDRETLTPIVRRALASENTELIDWRHEPFAYVSTLREYRGLYHFSGSARVGTETRLWSLVLKVIRRSPSASTEPDHPVDWRREVLAYSSGLLDDLPGVAAPHCYGINDPSDEAAMLWLEYVEDEHDGRWPVERYGLASRHLGRLNGAYVSGRELPDHEWLHASRAAEGGGAGERIEKLLRSEKTWQHPEVRRVFPEPIAERALRQREDWRAFRAAATQQPRTLCHLDAGRQNLFARRRADGADETVLIDWELMGFAPLATEITYLVMQTLRRFDVDIDAADHFEELVLDSYIAGLRDAGWRGDPQDVRFAYTAGIALRLGLIPQVLGFIFDEDKRARIEPGWGRPADEVIERWARLAYFVLDHADEARKLLQTE